VYVSGQIATRDGQLIATGRLGDNIDVATGQEAAQVCALNVLAQLNAAAGAHARSAIGVAALPLRTPVEVEAIAELVSDGGQRS
jgi:enamine deaminase RidA (YjgF/YER057c/UK114 family)